MTNSNVGRYIHANTFVHRLDARVKFFMTITYVVLVFLSTNMLTTMFLLIPLVFLFILGTKKPLKLISLFKAPVWIGVFLFFINIFTIRVDANSGIPIYVDTSVIQISYKNITVAIEIILRVYLIMIVINIFTLSTTPTLLSKTINWYLTPLKIFRIPVDIFTTILVVALRFIPTLLDEAQRIVKAQASRGVDFNNGNLKTKTKAMIVLIVPLFVSAFAKADDLANAMETRGYNPYKKSTSYHQWNFGFWDGLVLFLMLGILITTSLIFANVIALPSWWSLFTILF